jgi:hypothetical protein
MKDSLWSLDLFRCESATLQTHWVLVVIDQFSGALLGLVFTAVSWMEWRYAGCSIERFAGKVCRNTSARNHDPLYRFHQWQANLRVLEVAEIKTVPYVPLSHPFIERVIGTVRRAYLDPDSILDHGRSGDEATRFPTLQ